MERLNGHKTNELDRKFDMLPITGQLYIQLADNLKTVEDQHTQRLLKFGQVGLFRQMDEIERSQLADFLTLRNGKIQRPHTGAHNK